MSATEDRDTAVPDGLEAALAEREPGGGELLRSFAGLYLRRAPDAERPVTAVAAELAGAFELTAARGRAPAAVRAFTPREDRDGYSTGASVLETNTDDLPFLVDTVTALVRGRGIGVERVVHPILGTQRDPAGGLAAVLHPTAEGARRESVMHFELDRRLAPEELAALEDAVRNALESVRAVVGDFAELRARLDGMAQLARQAAERGRSGDESEEAVAFLRWLGDEHAVLLGYREYERTAEGGLRMIPGTGFGLLRDEAASSFRSAVAPDRLVPAVREMLEPDGELVRVARTNRVSPVHRRERMDDVVVQRIGEDGAVTGLVRLLCLLTQRAYAEPASRTPLLHRKLRRLLAAEELVAGSHDYKAAVALFDSFPKSELFAAPADDVRAAITALISLRVGEVRLLGRRHRDDRSVSLIAAVPRRGYSAELRDRFRAAVAARCPADVSIDQHEVLDEHEHVRLHLIVHRAAGALPDVPLDVLERDLLELARTWDDRARQCLARRFGDERGRMLAARWAARLPRSYKAYTDPEAAVHDIVHFERLLTTAEPVVVGLRNEEAEGRTRAGIFTSDGKAELSRVLPLLEDLGLRVIEERPTRLRGGDGRTWLQDFAVLGPGDRPLDLDACGDRVADAIAAAWRGEAESDSLNRLIVTAGLDRRQIAILRAYRKYRQRIGSRFTEGYQNDVLAENPGLVAKLIELFELRFDPAREPDEAALEAVRAEILEALDQVASLDHDRILRNQLGIIEATVRTSAYVPGRRTIAFKLRSADVPAIPQPPPRFEIYVHSPEMEGIHLRGGRIARGGIRWSDRMDYRTEVFGLMRAQMIKNAVIVPDGAKGGFYLRRPPADPAALREAVRAGYVDYIGGLLDVTDNLVDGRTVGPDHVRVLDDEDAYLVVAADKGTAALSDTANAIAEERGFWLGDAFASGGSKGYDHKALGITARGAWKSLERHFREMGLDPQRDVFTTVGIGDMSGDVFGNGMLLSDRIKLVAAYDHRHVFLDPDPDPERSFAERRRLFELPGSSWADYDPAVLSEGGGVFPRTAKAVRLTPQVRAALGVQDAVLTPSELIRAILRAPVDVLWNGGIGTVVKASTETDADAADRASDAIRVDAGDLRCRVVAEGGNLGLTHRARIEYARAGGRVSADFIDNSAGVNCSDHEVNLKILLNLAERAGDLDRQSRDELLLAVTEDVCRHVLYESYLQAQVIEQEARCGAEVLFAYEDLMLDLERRVELDRQLEALPGSEVVAERRRAGRGLERPEIAVLVAYAKRSLTIDLLRSELIDDPFFERDLRAYFPGPVVAQFGHLLPEHPLRRELTATIVANQVVDALGPTFVARLVAEQGAEPADVVRAIRIARAVVGADARWEAIEALDAALERDLFWELLIGVDWLVETVARWYLGEPAGEPVGAVVERDRPAFEALAAAGEELGAEGWREERDARAAQLVEAGVPPELARAHAFQPALAHAPDIIAVARALDRSAEDVASVFRRIGDGLRIHWLERELDGLPAPSRSQRWAQQAIQADLLRARRELAELALRESPGADPEEAATAFLASRSRACRRLAQFTRTIVEGGADFPGLMLAVRQVRGVAEG